MADMTTCELLATLETRRNWAELALARTIIIIITITRIFIQDNLSVLVKRTVIKRVL